MHGVAWIVCRLCEGSECRMGELYEDLRSAAESLEVMLRMNATGSFAMARSRLGRFSRSGKRQ
jgi:hypothetical protein